jgi:hypothetical protein
MDAPGGPGGESRTGSAPGSRPGIVFAIAFGLVVTLVFADAVFESRTFAQGYLSSFFFPLEKAVHEAWSHGRVPIWMPELSFGRALAANPNHGVFYPLQFAMAAIPFSAAFKIYPLLHLWLAGVGAFVLCRFLGASDWAAALAGAVFALSGPAVSEILLPDFIPGLALLPWVIWSAGRLAREPGPPRIALLGALLGIDLLGGDAVSVGLAGLGGLLLLWDESPPGRRSRAFGGLAIAAGCGSLLAGIQIVPTLLWAPLTARALEAFPIGKSLLYSVSPWRLLELAVPLPFGNIARERAVWGDGLWSHSANGLFHTFYAGPLAALAILFARPPRGRRGFLYGFPAICLGLACAGSFASGALLRRPSPIPLRFPEKLMVGFALGLAVLASILVDRIRRRADVRAARAAAAVALLLLVASVAAARSPAAVAAFADEHWSTVFHRGSLAAKRLPTILSGSAARWGIFAGLLALAAGSRRRAIAPLLVLGTAVDLGQVARSFVKTSPESLVFADPPSARAIRKVNGAHGLYGFMPLQGFIVPELVADPFNVRWLPDLDADRLGLDVYTGAAFGVTYGFNYDFDISDLYRVELARREFTRQEGRSAGVADLLASYSVRAAILHRGVRMMGFTSPSGRLGPDWIVRNDSALPAVRFARRVRQVRNLNEDWWLVHLRKVDLLRTTLMETGREREETLGGGTVRLFRTDPNRFSAETTTAGPAVLLLVRAFSPYREVLLDGRPTPFFPANLCLTAVPIPPGRHRLDLRERLPGAPLATLATGAGLMALALLALLGRGRDA